MGKEAGGPSQVSIGEETEESVLAKRKVADEAEVPSKIAKRNENEVVPREEPMQQ